MGVPAFFRWLSRKYVSIIVDAVEERRQEVEGIKIPVDCTQPNLNYQSSFFYLGEVIFCVMFQEFDILYLDMNGIIHPCTHPEDRPAPKTEDEMLFSIVRPRKLLYMAIDGVAPRAKMNQQRSRRFRAAKEAADKRAQIASIRKKLEDEGVPLPPPRKEEEHFDSNCITPGTPFMARLSTALRYYIHKRITYDPAWMKIQVILSDANAPGEGEHKIMDYIRRQRASPSHDPNTVHCLCGADADLIMLGLATHEANFNIIREEFVPNQPKACELCGQYGHELEHCQGLARAEAGPDQADPLKKEKNFIFIRLPVLREYLERELVLPNLPFPFDLERVIDDWVMLCFFVGNDFLPHLPSLEIRENAIDRLVKLYKNMVYQTGGWLTNDGVINIDRVKIIMNELGKVEDQIFKERQLRELKYKESQKQRKIRAKEAAAMLMPYNASLIAPQPINSQNLNKSGEEIRKMATDDRKQANDLAAEQAQKLKSLLTPVGVSSDQKGGLKRKIEHNVSDSPTGPPPVKSFKDGRVVDDVSTTQDPKPTIVFTTPSGGKAPLAKGAVGALMNDDSDEEEATDEIRLWEDGWKERYYRAKFNVEDIDHELRKNVVCAYMEGLSWVLLYYYQGCASWTWYFPYHYAPFASDFYLAGDYKPDFSKQTRPFKPLEQLMGVFPAASRAHIPESWHWLMTDEKSPIIDFYPNDFEIDLNGKKYAWQGVALLPFVDEKRLLDALDLVYDKLDEEEQARNITGPDRLFVGHRHGLFELMHSVHKLSNIGDSSISSSIEQSRTSTGNNDSVENDKSQSTEESNQTSQSTNDDSGERSQSNGDQNSKTTSNEETNETNDNIGNSVVEKQWVIIDASKAYGMAGEISADYSSIDYGVNYSSMFRNSLEFGDIKNNSCIMVQFRDPQFPPHFQFKACRLDGIKELPRALKPQNYDDRRQGPYRPLIGFSRDVPRASLSTSGHRTLNHHVTHRDRRSGPSSLFCYQSQHIQTSPQTLPWHSNSAQQQYQIPFNNLQQPVPLNFMQLAMPPPPIPPQNWVSPPPQQHSYIGQWGQPPVQPQQYNNQRNNNESWRR
ncbi:5'-3' exoribonuclease [Meloidogyne graminicola]|uniref:5'-3' exoribonuclease n=1 Tax=Meloidogyne graminicola TaxID=189291 RepID=A0A8T0A3R8_9BILA|nr:5'-3' exoribonuclease [Meloidogyne graminicola]